MQGVEGRPKRGQDEKEGKLENIYSQGVYSTFNVP